LDKIINVTVTKEQTCCLLLGEW